MSLDNWVTQPERKPATVEEVRGVVGHGAIRAERLVMRLGKYSNVRVVWERTPYVPDEFTAVTKITQPAESGVITVTVVALGTRDKDEAEDMVARGSAGR